MADPSTTTASSDRARLRAIAIAAMRDRGFETGFSADAIAAANAADVQAGGGRSIRDLRDWPWCSIDNDDSRDLDQLSAARQAPGGATQVLVAIADVDAAVGKASPIDRHAALNTTSVYTPAIIFPMLPERLSTDLTSLADHEDRLAVVMDFTVAADGTLSASEVYAARVRNRAKLAYHAVDAWLTGDGPLPAAAAAAPGMDAQLRMQDGAAQALSRQRHAHGALDLDTGDIETEFEDGGIRAVRESGAGRARALIENFMIAANGVTARFLDAHGLPSLRRVVRQPARWDRLVALAAQTGDHLPAEPDSRALAAFLEHRRAKAPDGFRELSRTVVKLLGSGEYVVDEPGGDPPGHFGLAVKDYTHSTAPNRRYPDLVTQRLLKAALVGGAAPYSVAELTAIAAHCTEREDAANRVERQVRKSAAALMMESRVGARFAAVVSGTNDKGVWVRIDDPPVEGKLVRGEQGLDVGDRLTVRLVRVDVDRGFIDFERA